MARSFDIKRMPGFTTTALFCFLVLYLPIMILVAFSFNAGTSVAQWDGFSLRWFTGALGNAKVIEASARSIQIAMVAALASTTVATMAAIATTRTRPYRGIKATFAVLSMPLMVPEIITAVALLILVAKIKVATGYDGMGYLFVAHTAFCIPFAYLPIRARLETMDRVLETAAADLYASPWNAFRRITLPLLWPGIFSGLMLAFVVSLDDVIITEFIKSAGQETLPTYILGQLRRAVTPELNAISAVFLLLSVGVVTVFFFASKKRN